MAEQLLAGQHAVVTGGGTGIGRASAEALAAAGAGVTLMGRDEKRLESVAAALPGARWQRLDVTDEASVADAFEAAGSTAPVTILVNNAGGESTAPFMRTTVEQWRQMLDVNLTGTFLCTRAALPQMLDAGQGRIINIASTAGLKGYPYTSAYTASKHGVVGLTRSLALEMARKPVTVNCVCPGFTDTELVSRSLDRIVEKTGRSRDQALTEFVKSNPQGRLVEVDEVAAAVVWLALPVNRAITGQSLVVAGGEIM